MTALDLPDAEMWFFPRFLPRREADRLLGEISETTAWRQETIKLYGRESPVPRLTRMAWRSRRDLRVLAHRHAAGAVVRTAAGDQAADRGRSGCAFNSVLCNLYRTARTASAGTATTKTELGAAGR